MESLRHKTADGLLACLIIDLWLLLGKVERPYQVWQTTLSVIWSVEREHVAGDNCGIILLGEHPSNRGSLEWVSRPSP